MNTAIYVKTDPEVKKKAQKVAKELGYSLSSLMNAWLRQLVKTKKTHLEGEVPTEYLKRAIKQAEKDLKEGKASPSFDNIEDAIAWLHEDR